jgi:hypothetical protein
MLRSCAQQQQQRRVNVRKKIKHRRLSPRQTGNLESREWMRPSAHCPGSAMRNVSTRSSDTRMISSRPAERPYDGCGGCPGYIGTGEEPYPPGNDERPLYVVAYGTFTCEMPLPLYDENELCEVRGCDRCSCIEGGESVNRHRRLLPWITCDIEPVSTLRISTNVGSNAST